MPARSPARVWQYVLLGMLLAVALAHHAGATVEIVRTRFFPKSVNEDPLGTQPLTSTVA